MQYNFEVRDELPAEEVAGVLAPIREGLEGTIAVVARVAVRVNTELPAEDIAPLTEAVSALISEKLGGEATASLISQEH